MRHVLRAPARERRVGRDPSRGIGDERPRLVFRDAACQPDHPPVGRERDARFVHVAGPVQPHPPPIQRQVPPLRQRAHRIGAARGEVDIGAERVVGLEQRGGIGAGGREPRGRGERPRAGDRPRTVEREADVDHRVGTGEQADGDGHTEQRAKQDAEGTERAHRGTLVRRVARRASHGPTLAPLPGMWLQVIAQHAAEHAPQVASDTLDVVDPTFRTTEHAFQTAFSWLRLAVETIGALVIGAGVVVGVVQFLRASFARQPDGYTDVRLRLARFLAVALEFQLGADLLSTAIAPSWTTIRNLAAIAIIRTGLNYFLGREMQDEAARLATAGEAPAVATRRATGAAPTGGAPTDGAPGTSARESAARA